MSRILIRRGTVVTMEQPNRVLPDHAVLIEDGVIRKIIPQKAAGNIRARVIDARGKVVMPGFINTHMHFYASFARGLTGVAPARNFPAVLRNLWWRLDRNLTLEDCHASTLTAGIEAIRHGTTTIFDHHASPCAIKGSLSAIAEAVRQLGLRACLCYEVSDRDGREIAGEGIEENLRFLDSCREPDGYLRALFGLHASFTLGQKTLSRCARVAAGRQAGFHIHCAEDIADQRITQRRFRRPVVRRLAEEGILGPRSICAHAVHISDREWDLLAKSCAAVAHNPQSNMNNAVGVMDLLKAVRMHVLVGLGTDAMTGNMLEELRAAIWAQRLAQRDPGAAFDPVVDLLIRNNQEIANRHFSRVGQIREGWQADLVCIDYFPPTCLNAANFAGHLVFGISQAAVDTAIVGGRILMENKQLQHLDEARITRRSRELASALWKRMGGEFHDRR